MNLQLSLCITSSAKVLKISRSFRFLLQLPAHKLLNNLEKNGIIKFRAMIHFFQGSFITTMRISNLIPRQKAAHALKMIQKSFRLEKSEKTVRCYLFMQPENKMPLLLKLTHNPFKEVASFWGIM